jgi:hypothetical protein
MVSLLSVKPGVAGPSPRNSVIFAGRPAVSVPADTVQFGAASKQGGSVPSVAGWLRGLMGGLAMLSAVACGTPQAHNANPACAETSVAATTPSPASDASAKPQVPQGRTVSGMIVDPSFNGAPDANRKAFNLKGHEKKLYMQLHQAMMDKGYDYQGYPDNMVPYMAAINYMKEEGFTSWNQVPADQQEKILYTMAQMTAFGYGQPKYDDETLQSIAAPFQAARELGYGDITPVFVDPTVIFDKCKSLDPSRIVINMAAQTETYPYEKSLDEIRASVDEVVAAQPNGQALKESLNAKGITAAVTYIPLGDEHNNTWVPVIVFLPGQDVKDSMPHWQKKFDEMNRLGYGNPKGLHTFGPKTWHWQIERSGFGSATGPFEAAVHDNGTEKLGRMLTVLGKAQGKKLPVLTPDVLDQYIDSHRTTN